MMDGMRAALVAATAVAVVGVVALSGRAGEFVWMEGEAQITRCHDAVLAADSTRSVMTDGGGAMKNNTLGVHGDHYVARLDVRYPDLAYQPFVEGGGWVAGNGT